MQKIVNKKNITTELHASVFGQAHTEYGEIIMLAGTQSAPNLGQWCNRTLNVVW